MSISCVGPRTLPAWPLRSPLMARARSGALRAHGGADRGRARGLTALRRRPPGHRLGRRLAERPLCRRLTTTATAAATSTTGDAARRAHERWYAVVVRAPSGGVDR